MEFCPRLPPKKAFDLVEIARGSRVPVFRKRAPRLGAGPKCAFRPGRKVFAARSKIALSLKGFCEKYTCVLKIHKTFVHVMGNFVQFYGHGRQAHGAPCMPMLRALGNCRRGAWPLGARALRRPLALGAACKGGDTRPKSHCGWTQVRVKPGKH